MDAALQLLFGSGHLTEEDVTRWYAQGFTLSKEDPSLRAPVFGLLQRAGGPCGVLVCVQAFLLTVLVHKAALDESGLALVPAGSGTSSGSSPFKPLKSIDEGAVDMALCSALARVVWQAAGADVEEASLVLPADSGAGVTAFTAFTVTPAASFADLEGLIASALPQFAAPGGIILLLLSLVLTRGVEKIKADMDEATALVVQFGHTSTELLNLLLTGAATSGVFDGEQVLGEGADCLRLRGISSRPLVGYLSAFDAYATPGSFLKSPVYPVWIIASESHFTLLWARDAAVLEESPASASKRSFAKYEPTPEAGFIPATSLAAFMAELGKEAECTDAFAASLDEDGLGIIFWTKLWARLAPMLSAPQPLALFAGGSGAATTGASIGQPTASPAAVAQTVHRSFASPSSPAMTLSAPQPENLDPDILCGLLISLCYDCPTIINECVHVSAIEGLLSQLRLRAEYYPIVGRGLASFVTTLSRASHNPALAQSMSDADEYVPIDELGKAFHVSLGLSLPALVPPPILGQKRARAGSSTALPDLDDGKGDAGSVGAVLGFDTPPSLSPTMPALAPRLDLFETREPDAVRVFDLYHYNGLYDRHGRAPVFTHLVCKQSSDAFAVDASQGGIEEQTAAAMALSMLPASTVGIVSPPVGLHSRGVRALEGILRTRWSGLTITALDGPPPSLD